MRVKVFFRGFALLVIVGVAFFLLGWLLDREAERAVLHAYPRNEKGILWDATPMQVVAQKTRAVLWLHGFSYSPLVFRRFMQDADLRKKADMYAPLLPYHGRGLQDLKKMNLTVLQRYIAHEMTVLSRQYTHVTVVAHALSATLVLRLLAANQVPPNITVVLYAPSLYLRANTSTYQWMLRAYGIWRDYCNYLPFCPRVSRHVTDETGWAIRQQYTFPPYLVVPALRAVLAFDSPALRRALGEIKRKFYVVLAKDDSIMRASAVQKVCLGNAACTVYQFPTGSHYLHLGTHYQAFKAIMLKLINL